MKCEHCGFEGTRVCKSVKHPDRIDRRRTCEKCGYRFTSHEVRQRDWDSLNDSLEQITRERDELEARLSLLMAERDYGPV